MHRLTAGNLNPKPATLNNLNKVSVYLHASQLNLDEVPCVRVEDLGRILEVWVFGSREHEQPELFNPLNLETAKL